MIYFNLVLFCFFVLGSTKEILDFVAEIVGLQGILWDNLKLICQLVSILFRSLYFMNRKERQKKNTSLLPLYLVVFLDVLGFGIIIPVIRDYTELLAIMSNYESQNFAFLSGVLMTSYSLFQFLFAPILGMLSDRYGRRLILIISVAGNIVSYFLWAISQSFLVFLFSRILSGMTGGNISVAQSYVADMTARKDRAKVMAIIGAVFGVGFTVGPFLGGMLSVYDLSKLSFGWIVFNRFSAIGLTVMFLSLVNLVWIFFRVGESNQYSLNREKNKSDKATISPIKNNQKVGLFSIWMEFRRPILGRLFLIGFLNMIAFVSFESLMAWDLKDRFAHNTQMTGYFFAYIGILLSIVQGGLYRVAIRRFSERQLLGFGFFLLSTSLIVLPLLPTYTLILMNMIPLVMGIGFINPSINALASLYASDQEQGVVLGLLQGFGAMARSIAPVLATFVYDEISTALPFFVAGLLAASLIWLMRSLPDVANKVRV